MVSETYFANSRAERVQMEDCYGNSRFDKNVRWKPVQETGTIQNCLVMQEKAAAQQKLLYNITKPENKEQQKPQNIVIRSIDLETGNVEISEIILKEEVLIK